MILSGMITETGQKNNSETDTFSRTGDMRYRILSEESVYGGNSQRRWYLLQPENLKIPGYSGGFLFYIKFHRIPEK